LVSNRDAALARYTEITKVPEMIVSTLFLLTGIYQFYLLGAIKLLQIFKLISIFIAIPIAIIGFKKKNKRMAILALVLIHTAYILAELARGKSYLKTKTEKHVDAASIGQSVYRDNCVICHGDIGNKGYNGATDLSQSHLEKDSILAVLKYGIGNMMPFEDKLNVEERNAVAEYITTLR
jgi:mono/diheme cytochrome c family protein